MSRMNDEGRYYYLHIQTLSTSHMCCHPERRWAIQGPSMLVPGSGVSQTYSATGELTIYLGPRAAGMMDRLPERLVGMGSAMLVPGSGCLLDIFGYQRIEDIIGSRAAGKKAPAAKEGCGREGVS